MVHHNRLANAELLAGLDEAGPWTADVAVCAPYPYLSEVALSLQGKRIAWGAQDCSMHEAGAYTGEVSAAMLAEFGCRYVIVGHSERRAYHRESDQLVADKANVLILDEPINHLDIPSREQFEAALDAFPGTILVAVHDRAFIERFATGVWAVQDGKLKVYYE